jgi:hypothetical protein
VHTTHVGGLCAGSQIGVLPTQPGTQVAGCIGSTHCPRLMSQTVPEAQMPHGLLEHAASTAHSPSVRTMRTMDMTSPRAGRHGSWHVPRRDV